MKSFIVDKNEKHEQKNKEMDKIMINLKDKILEASKIEQSLEKSLKEKQMTYEIFEAELAFLRKELDSKHVQMKYENNSKILDEIIITQRDPSNKNGIGYSPEENQGNSKHYAAALLRPVKKKDEENAYNNQDSKKSSPIKKE